QYGGFFWGVDDHGRMSPFFGDRKELYGESFAMYGAAAAYQATRDPKALLLAQNAFRWIDGHAHDAKNGGGFLWGSPGGENLGGKINQQPRTGGVSIRRKTKNHHPPVLRDFCALFEGWLEEKGDCAGVG